VIGFLLDAADAFAAFSDADLMNVPHQKKVRKDVFGGGHGGSK
jgi:hypothetical protein